MGVLDNAASPKALSAVNMFTEELMRPKAAPVATEPVAKAVYELSPDDIEMYRFAFTKFDADGSGSIDKSELSSLLATMGLVQTQDELTKMMSEADGDGSGEIDAEEFIGLMSKHIGSQAEVLEGELRYAFDALDADRSGTVSAAELKMASANLGEKLSTEEVDAMLALVDNDGSGEIDFEEFCACARTDSSVDRLGAVDGFTTEVLRRKFRSVLRMLVLQRRITDAFSKVNNAAYQWQRFTNIEKISTVSAAIKSQIVSVAETASIGDALQALDGHVCMPVVATDGSIKGFVDIFDILGFVTNQLRSQFQVQIDFKAQDVARQSLHGREHLQQSWAVHEQHQVNMGADVLRARLLKISLPGPCSAMHNTPVSAIMSADCRTVRPGFSVSDVSGQLSQSSAHRVPLVGWDQKPLAVISQLSILEALGETGKREERVGLAATVRAEDISEEISVVPSFAMALSAFQMLLPNEAGVRPVQAVAVADEATGKLLGEITAESLKASSGDEKLGGQQGLATLSLPCNEFISTVKQRSAPRCHPDTELHEVLSTCIRAAATQVWVVDAEDRPMGMITATSLIAAIVRGGK
eukprot:COSAG05_NODE_586_length_8516_cov_12.928122_1_plen_584_part_00